MVSEAFLDLTDQRISEIHISAFSPNVQILSYLFDLFYPGT